MARKSKHLKFRKTVVLICEGDVEIEYFKNMKKEEQFAFQIKPDKPKHSSSIKEFEKKLSKAIDDDFDKIFCIIDLDRILQNRKEKEKYDKLKHKFTNFKNIRFIESIPCFEFWLLLHFVYTTRCFRDCNQVERKLNKYECLDGYNKTMEYHSKMKLYTFLKDRLDPAIKRAKKAENNRNQNSGKYLYPKSDVYKLIEEILDMRSET
jgi:hypothetical protein